MIKLAIRDDDMNFFTKVEDHEYIYKDFNHFPISYAVVPYVLDVSTRGVCSDTKGNTMPQDVADNKALVEWVRHEIKNGTCDVLLHGVHHSYKFTDKGVKLAEMQWRDNEPNLADLLRAEKERLSALFDYPITCFVAPSNKITKYCLGQVAKAGLNFSGIIPMKPNVNLTIKNIANYAKRWMVRAIHKLPYPGVLQYDNHKEVNACIFQTYDYLVKMFEFCCKHNYPMVINVHYWHLLDNPTELEKLRKFVMDYAIPRGAIPTRLSDLLKYASI